MGEAAGPGIHSLGAIQAKLDEQIPHIYRDLALYLQVLREVLPSGLDQACSHLATQVHPRSYNSLHQAARQQLHARLKSLSAHCCSLLTVEQLLILASRMERERQRLALREQQRLLQRFEDGLESSHEELPAGSIQLHLAPPLRGDMFPFPVPPLGHAHGPEAEDGTEDEGEAEFSFSLAIALRAHGLSALDERPARSELGWSRGQLPRDPELLIHCLEGFNVALSRRLRNLSHSVNLEMMRAGLIPGVVPVPLLDAVLMGQIEPQGAPPNLLRLPLGPPDPGLSHPPMGVLLRTVDLEMEQPRLRTCRRRLLHHRQDIQKMAETSHRLQRRLQAHHAERLWRHDSQLNPPAGI